MSNIGNKETIARNLAYYVNASGKSQKEIATVVGVAASTFSEWMKGNKYPRIDKIEMLADFFGILKSDLIEDKKPAQERAAERAAFDAAVAKDEDLRSMIKMYQALPDDKKKTIKQMVEDYYAFALWQQEKQTKTNTRERLTWQETATGTEAATR